MVKMKKLIPLMLFLGLALALNSQVIAESIADPTGTNLLGLGAWNQNATSVYLKDSSKNVGIGTTSPGIKFQVNTAGVATDETQARFVNPKPGNTYSNIELGFNTNDGQSSPIGRIRTFSIDGSPGTQSGRMYLQTMLAGTWQNGVTILETGNVGIGTTGPASILHIQGNNPRLILGTDGIGNSQTSSLYLKAQNTESPADRETSEIVSGYSGREYVNSYLRFRTLNSSAVLTDTVTITNGSVGIGTTDPAQVLDVQGNIKLSGNIVSDGDICIGECD